MKSFELAPEFAERLRAGQARDPARRHGRLPNFFRKPYGPGWALVGDAGYHKHPITAFGITTPSAMPKRSRPLSTTPSPGAPYDDAWPVPARPRPRCCRSTRSRAIREARAPSAKRCSSSSGPCRATRRQWTTSSASCGHAAGTRVLRAENAGRIMAQAAHAAEPDDDRAGPRDAAW